jgi:hypothetical protein
MFVGGHAVHCPGDEVHIIYADADAHQERAHRHQREPRQQSHCRQAHKPVVAMTGPDARAKRSRLPDQPETVKVAVVQPIDMTMLRKLITTGDRSICTDQTSAISNR